MIRILGVVILASTFALFRASGAEVPRVFVTASETSDASNSRDKAKHVDFGADPGVAQGEPGSALCGARTGRGIRVDRQDVG